MEALKQMGKIGSNSVPDWAAAWAKVWWCMCWARGEFQGVKPRKQGKHGAKDVDLRPQGRWEATEGEEGVHAKAPPPGWVLCWGERDTSRNMVNRQIQKGTDAWGLSKEHPSVSLSTGKGQREAVLPFCSYSLHWREILPAPPMFGLMRDLL